MKRREVLMVTIYLGVVFALEPPSISKQYRTDYQYNRETDAFYKLHLPSKNYDDAKQMCINEGAELMVPASQQDVMQFQQMLNSYPYYGENVWIGHEELPKEEQFNGGTTTQEYVTEDPCSDFEPPTETLHDAMTRNGDIIAEFEMRELPFICKVKAEDAPFNSVCQVYGKDYECNTTVGSCYKISYVAMTWIQAYLECRDEGSHLVILNSETEQQVVWDLLKKIPNYAGRLYYSAGFRAASTFSGPPRVFRTIFRETLEEAGYDKWAEGEPSNYADSEYCGSIYKIEGKLNDFDCYSDHLYICEKEIPQKIVE